MPRPSGNDDHAAHIDVEAAVDALYADDPDGFTAARDDLARRLRVAGRRQDAATVKGLRRPTVAAWAVNRVARERADEVARLRAIGDDLRRAQDAVLQGGAGGSRADADRLRELATTRRAATSALVEAAVAAVVGRGVSADPHRDDIVGTFDAVAADPSLADAVATARLARPLEVPVGLGAPDAEIMAFAASPDEGGPTRKAGADKRAKKGAPSKASPAAKPSGPAGSKRGGRVHVLDAAEVRKARARAVKAHEAEEAAAREVARLEAALTTARREAARAKEAASRADAAARAADATASRSTG